MSTHAPDLDDVPVVDFHDAVAVALHLVERFRPPFCGAWLGHADGSLCDLLVVTGDDGNEVDALLRAVDDDPVAGCPAADRALLVRSVDDVGHVDTLVDRFLLHGSALATAGLTLLDEIVYADEWFRSLEFTVDRDHNQWTTCEG